MFERIQRLDEDRVLGRNLRRLADALPVLWRIGLLRTEDGWRLVLLNPESGDPVSFIDGPDLDSVVRGPSGLRGHPTDV